MAKQSREDWKIYKNVFDNFTIQTVFKLISEGHFDGLYSPFRLGKEANVFLAEKGDEIVIVKIYRLESCNFNKMYEYIKSDPRYVGLKKQRRKIIFSWVQREYRNLIKARERLNVPTPYTFKNNCIVMEMVGDKDPAQQLKDVDLENPEKTFNDTITATKKLYSLGLVHGDLSEFNILYHRSKPYFIDFSQGTAVKDPRSMALLKRDVDNVCRFFQKHGVDKDPSDVVRKIVSKL